MRGKGLIAALVIGLLLVVAIFVFTRTRNSSPQAPEATSSGEATRTEIQESNTPTEEAEDQEKITSITVTPAQTPSPTQSAAQMELVVTETPVPATATVQPPQAGAVTIVTDKEEYSVGDVIVVTVRNNLDVPITTVNQQAFCSLIRMESLEGGDWQEVQNCFSTEPVSQFTIDAGGTRVEELLAFAAGTYRVGLLYSTGEAYDAGNLLDIFTPSFEVKG